MDARQKVFDHTLLALAICATLAWIYWQLKEESPTYQAETGTAAPPASIYDGILGNGGMPPWGPVYWGANAPVATGDTINVDVDPDYLASLGMSYMPLFGFVGIATPDITSGPSS